MNRADFRQSPVLADAGFRHAFFTRKGGVSSGAYATLNFSWGVGDDATNVDQNLERAARELGVERHAIHFLTQVHGRETVVVDGSEGREDTLERRGDAVLTATKNVACGVRVADCVPVLLGDCGSGAVAAVHVGWRGAVAGILAAAIGSLRDLGKAGGRVVAAIGPHISLRAFEVSGDVAAQLAACSPDGDVVDTSLGPKPHVDLRRITRAQLRQSGIDDADIDDVLGCTVIDSEAFFSYRRDGKKSGRHLAAILPRTA